LPEVENLIADCDLVPVTESNGMIDSAFVQKRSVAAAEIDQPKFPNILQMNESVPARHFGRFQHDRINGGPSERTTATDRIAGAIGRFQPSTFLLGVVHAATSYRN
jgi:hypothetical protein